MHTVPASSATAPPSLPPAGPPDGPGDEPTDEGAVARLMARVAAGDRPAIWSLREVADVPVRARVRGELRRLGVRYEAEDLDALVTDAVLALADVAGTWRPGGAPPWAWAHHRVVGVVHRFVGTFADSLDEIGGGDPDGALGWLESRVTGTSSASGLSLTAVDPEGAVGDTLGALARLAATSPEIAALDAALTAVASRRDRAVWLAVLDERASGNGHPAVTVGARFAMRPEAVRQAVHRVWGRLEAMVADGGCAGVATLPVLVARGRMAQ